MENIDRYRGANFSLAVSVNKGKESVNKGRMEIKPSIPSRGPVGEVSV